MKQQSKFLTKILASPSGVPMALSILDPHFRKGGKGVPMVSPPQAKRFSAEGGGYPPWGKIR